MTNQRWTLAVVGLWVAVSTFLGFGSEGSLWSNLFAGLVVIAMGTPLGVEVRWEGWTEGILGVWLIIAALVPGLREGSLLAWNNILAGLAILLAAVIVPRQHVPRHV